MSSDPTARLREIAACARTPGSFGTGVLFVGPGGAAAVRNVAERQAAILFFDEADVLLRSHRLTLLTTDNDFILAAAHCPLRVWKRPC